jgi:Flp pilus assembly protein TadB
MSIDELIEGLKSKGVEIVVLSGLMAFMLFVLNRALFDTIAMWIFALVIMFLFVMAMIPRSRSPEEAVHYRRRQAELEAERDFKGRW